MKLVRKLITASISAIAAAVTMKVINDILEAEKQDENIIDLDEIAKEQGKELCDEAIEEE